jgi:hypothetical protein
MNGVAGAPADNRRNFQGCSRKNPRGPGATMTRLRFNVL